MSEAQERDLAGSDASDIGRAGNEAQRATQALLELMARLRDPVSGCPWDVEQTFATVAPYTLEEAYEVADAIDRGDPAQLRDELGDLLFQVVFHSQMAQERGWFDFAAVARAIHAKLVRRHPHVFGAQVADDDADRARASAGHGVAGVRVRAPERTAEAQTRTWEELKALERAELAKGQAAADTSALANIPKALPALMRAAKIGRRAARVGFDWQAPAQVRAKVLEELGEVDDALAGAAATNAPRVTEEIGDLLFALANWTVHLKIDPEEALRAANAKFERRFRHMEASAAARGDKLESLSAAQWDELWMAAKRMKAVPVDEAAHRTDPVGVAADTSGNASIGADGGAKASGGAAGTG